ncbi:hypothetical protein OQA88_8844 [Cercophora sp. LCS_1]
MASVATKAAEAARKSFREMHGVVVTAGLMSKTVKVQVGAQKWNNFVKKYFNAPKTYLVHDPRDSLRAGDVVSIMPGWRASKHKRHIVTQIIKPYGTPIDERPPIPTEAERNAELEEEMRVKSERRALKKQMKSIETSLSIAEKTAARARRAVVAAKLKVGKGASIESEVD